MSLRTFFDVMTALPAISFLVCTRNRADIVRECVLNLLESTRSDFEIVVRDNCSTDNTLEILSDIRDDRLKIYCAPENQGTLTFYEASKLAVGDIVTWLSDEDNFQFSVLDHILEQFKNDPDCNVIFGGIVVGAKAREVKFCDAIVTNKVQACIIALSFSGCGGLFVKRAALPLANTFEVKCLDDAYALWNYYPVGFFASRCLEGTLRTTSRVVVVQKRFASTTNNWSKTSSDNNNLRFPHYYPESVFDRLASNIVNVWFKSLPFLIKIRIIKSLVLMFRMQIAGYVSPALIDLLNENYSEEIVRAYQHHVFSINLDRPIHRYVWGLCKVFFFLPLRLISMHKRWKKLFRA